METKRERGPVNLYLRKDLFRQLQQRAEQTGTSASALVEALIQLHLDTTRERV